MDLTEKTLSRKDIYDGHIVHLHVDEVALPDGSRSVREIIDHCPCVAVVALDGQDRVLTVTQYRYAFGRELLEIPAGKLEPGEDPFAAARRELEEECGLTAEHYYPLGEFYPTVGYCTEVIYSWAATGLHETHMHPDDDEFITPERVPLEKAVEMVLSGEIRDGKTIANILKLKALLENGTVTL